MNLALYHPWIKSKGGAEKLLLEVLEQSTHDVTLYTLFYDEENTFAGFADQDVQVLGSNRPPKGIMDKALRFGLGSLTVNIPLEEHDALVVSEAGLGSLAAIRNHDIPVICYCHTPLRVAIPEFTETYRQEVPIWKQPFIDFGVMGYDILEQWAWKHFDHVMANSALTKERILFKELAHNENVIVVNPGVDVDEFDPGDFEPYFLYPSRFRRYKRQDLAIQAFKEADLDGFTLVLAGSGQEQDYIDELREQAGENVEFHIDVSGEKWQELYENAYGVLFLAKNEDWGIVPLEGMAAGKPVIAVDEGGYTDVLHDGEHGFLVGADAGEIADAMQTLSSDEDRAKELGHSGRETVKQYSWDTFIERFDETVEAHTP